MRISATIAAGALLACCGCLVVPMRVPTKTHGQTGSEAKIDTAFLLPGTTTRDEVSQRLASADTHMPEKRFFWARWSTSSWGYFAGVGGYGGAAATAERAWGTHNLFITFDENGVVRDARVVGDKQLVGALNRTFAELPPEPVDVKDGEIDAEHVHSGPARRRHHPL